jgi:hypothetical protein
MALKFKVLVNNGIVNHNTVLNGKEGAFKITTEKQLCGFIYSIWRKQTSSASFQDWADELNADKNFEGGFTKFDALDNLCSNMIVNVEGQKNFSLYQFFQKNLPESLS